VKREGEIMKLIFIRHGDYNPKTEKLTLLGKFQIASIRKYLENEKVDFILSSPKARALEGAKILNKKWDVPLYISKDLREREILVTDNKVLQEDYQKNYFDMTNENENYETCKQFIERTIKGIKEAVCHNKEAETFVVMAHSSNLYAISAMINGIPKDHKIKWLQCNTGACIKFYIDKKSFLTSIE
jgi:broad specificity phosphatase PhoE